MKTFKFLKLPEATFLQNGSSPVLSTRKIWTSPVENIFNVDHVTLSLLAQGVGWSQKQDCTGNKHIWDWCYTFWDSPIDRKLSTRTPVIPFLEPILAHWEANPWVWYINTATTQNVYFLFEGDRIKVGLQWITLSMEGRHKPATQPNMFWTNPTRSRWTGGGQRSQRKPKNFLKKTFVPAKASNATVDIAMTLL